MKENVCVSTMKACTWKCLYSFPGMLVLGSGDIKQVTCDNWPVHVAKDMWHVMPDTWQWTHDTWHLTNDIWQKTQNTCFCQVFITTSYLTGGDRWQITGDMWHETLQVTCDTWHLETRKRVYPLAGFKHDRYNQVLPSCQVKGGQTDKFNKCNEHGNAFSIVASEY